MYEYCHAIASCVNIVNCSWVHPASMQPGCTLDEDIVNYYCPTTCMNIVMQLRLASISSIVPECILHPCSLDVLWMKKLSNVPAWVHHASSLDVLWMKILSIVPESILPSSLKILSNVPDSILHPAWMYSGWRYCQMFLSALMLTAMASWIYRRHPFVLGFDCFGCVHPSLVISLSFIAFTECNYKRL